jgi:hypothetical protein
LLDRSLAAAASAKVASVLDATAEPPLLQITRAAR